MNKFEARETALAGSTSREPTETERAVMQAWREVFELEEVSLDDDVLDLGVSSLAAVEMCLRLERMFGVEVTLASLLTASSVTALAGLIDARRAG